MLARAAAGLVGVARPRDALAMATYQVKYEGPLSLAVRVATLLADGEGVDLTSAEKPEHPEGSVEMVRLTLTLEGTTEAVMAAVDSVEAGLPPDASITVAGAADGT